MLHRVSDPQHRIYGHTREFVRSALQLLAQSGAKFVSVGTLVNLWREGKTPDPNSIAFTFDDGFDDQADMIEDVFVPLGCPATLFLITGLVDRNLWPWDDQVSYLFEYTRVSSAQITVGPETRTWDLSSPSSRNVARAWVQTQLKTVPNENIYDIVKDIASVLEVDLPSAPPDGYRPITWERARALERKGVEFAPHSITHRIFSRVSSDTAHRELSGSWQRLREELARPLPVFAWPTGRYSDFTERDMQIARDAGMLACVATEDDYAHVDPRGDWRDLYRIKRFSFPSNEARVLRYGSWLERARQFLPM